MNAKKKLGIESTIIGIIGIILFFDFMSIDAQIFGYTAPQWITTISNYFTISPMLIDILTTIAVLLIIAMMHTEREIGEISGRAKR
jgi:phage shock protein PspC (stress-responsive transcriptional regulator)